MIHNNVFGAMINMVNLVCGVSPSVSGDEVVMKLNKENFVSGASPGCDWMKT